MSTERIKEIAERHGLSEAGVSALAEAVDRGNGRSAQFSHPDLGGSGQWMAGGMTQIGEMGNHDLKAKVAAAAGDLASSAGSGDANGAASQGSSRDSRDDYQAKHRHPEASQSASQGSDSKGSDSKGSGRSGDWWPAELGSPASSGGQNDSAYAIFPDKHRLAVKTGDRVRVFDTGDRTITGVSQQQGSVDDTRWSTSDGDVTLKDLTEL